MLLHLSLLHFLIFLLPPPSSSAGLTGAKPGCQDHCGNVSIPYPFGVGSDCSLNPSFELTCNTSTDPPEVYVPLKNLQVNEINDEEIKVKFPKLALSWYGRGGNISRYDYNLSQTPYMFSEHNWLTAIGCDDMVEITGQANRSFGGGCVMYCKNRNDAGGFASCPDDDNNYGLGSGCCRSPIPLGTTSLAIHLSDVHTFWRESKLFSTSYAFIGEKVLTNNSEYSYRLSDLDNATIFESGNWVVKNTPQMRLDWRIGTENCDEAQKNTTTYVCKENSHCVDFENPNVGGYLCNCSSGYEGNPYLEPGCQDINECVVDSPCHSKANCKNTPGSFNCSCWKGYSGDGTKNDKGCERRRQSIVIIGLAGLSSGIGFILLLLTCIWLYKLIEKRKENNRKERFFKQNGGLILQQKTTEGSIRNAKHFPAKELEKATDNFNESRILGQGGQGIVYKGILSDGKTVAIKKSKHVHAEELEQFINEVVILLQVDHRNVVKLLGCCLETEIPLLVYEFVPNGTLFNLIHDANTQFPFLWKMRLKIAADIAGALAHLHSASSIPIYHRDIKSSNILLDEKYIVKVSDFGTSKSVEVDKTHFTTMVRGTFGYLDPEYFRSGQFTDKSDVYSFGVVLLELLTREKPISSEKTQDEKSLTTRFLALMEENNLDLILDPFVKEQGLREEVMAIASLAQRCLNSKGKMRPTMKEVATELASYNISQMSSTVEDERAHDEYKAMKISDSEYTWTFSCKSEFSSSSDTNLFISETQIV